MLAQVIYVSSCVHIIIGAQLHLGLKAKHQLNDTFCTGVQKLAKERCG